MILIEPDAVFPRAALPKRELSRFLADACERIGLSGEVNVLLSTDAHVQRLNKIFRHQNKPTDVLSFPAPTPVPSDLTGKDKAAGDLAISVDTARRQAEALGHSLKLEVQILMLHGLLHLAGWDHEQDTGQMGRRESKLRRHYGLPAGLIQRVRRAESEAVREGLSRLGTKASARATTRAKAVSGKLPATKADRTTSAGKVASARKTTPARKNIAAGKLAMAAGPASKSAPKSSSKLLVGARTR